MIYLPTKYCKETSNNSQQVYNRFNIHGWVNQTTYIYASTQQGDISGITENQLTAANIAT